VEALVKFSKAKNDQGEFNPELDQSLEDLAKMAKIGTGTKKRVTQQSPNRDLRSRNLSLMQSPAMKAMIRQR
jgi:hypothetical protein